MTDRPSAATPEEARIIGDWRSRMPSGGRDQDGWTTVTDDELLDLIRRAQAAQREIDARIVEGLPVKTYGSIYRVVVAKDRAAAAIRAGETA